MSKIEWPGPDATKAEIDAFVAREAMGLYSEIPWECSDCGHTHQGIGLANICIGCPCPRTTPGNGS